MKKKKEENTETNENGKKKTLPIVIVIVVLILIIGSCGSNKNKNNSISDSSISESSSQSEVSTSTSVANKVTTEQETTTISISATEEITSIVSTTTIDASPENFVNTVEEAIQGAVGENEYITNVVLTDDTLTISVDLSKADITIVPLEDLAIIRASSITDDFLELEQYDDLWNEIIIDFVDFGQVKKSKSDIIESPYGRYFNIVDSNDLLIYNSTFDSSILLESQIDDVSNNSSDEFEITSLEHGELLEYTTIAGPLVVKAKIEPSLTNKLTIHQNYMNVADIILNQGGNKFNEIQYWAVADMLDGSESKVISFTLDKSTIDGVYNGNIIDINLGDYVTDLWILPSLKE